MAIDKDLQSIQQARDLISKAKEAQKEFSQFSQEYIDAIVERVAKAVAREAESLAKMAMIETGFGKWQDKLIKNKLASEKLYEYIKDMKTVGIINEDKHKRIIEIGTPVGVIAALIPCTNPTSTTIFKSLIALKSGNAIVFSPHPSAIQCTLKAVEIMSDAAYEVGAPEGLISCLSILTMEGTNELLKNKDVALILATGGSAMVRAAYSSGTPALGVGPGNVPVFIERSANINKAVEKILESKTFDNGTVCASEQAVITENCIAEQVKQSLIRQGAYFLTGEKLQKVIDIMEKPSGGMNPKIVGKSAQQIAQIADIDIPEGTRVLMCEEKGVGKNYPFSKEKLTALLAFYTVDNWEEACELCFSLLYNGGLGHTLSIHSEDERVIKEFALKKPVSRLLVNTPSTHGAVGISTNLAPSLTLGCGAAGGNATSDNITPMHLMNVRRVAYGIESEASENTQTTNMSSIDVQEITRLVIDKLKKY